MSHHLYSIIQAEKTGRYFLLFIFTFFLLGGSGADRPFVLENNG